MVVTLRIDSKISFEYKELKEKYPKAFNVLLKKFKKKNPVYTNHERMGFYVDDMDEYKKAYTATKGGRIYFARGTKLDLLKFFKTHKIQTEILDRTLMISQKYPQEMKCSPRDDQPEFIELVKKYHQGLLLAPTSFGKTLTTLMTGYELQVPVIILVHRKLLQEQWIKEATHPDKFNLPKEYIGGCGGVFKKPKVGLVNICLYQSLAKPETLALFGNSVALFAFDEVQYAPIEACLKIIQHIPARYLIGMSADDKRKDKMHFMTKWYIGPILKRFEERDGANKILAQIRLLQTSYTDSEYEWDNDAVALETRASEDKLRNRFSVQRIKRQLDMGRQTLVCTSRKYHVFRLAKHFEQCGYRVGIIVGMIQKKDTKSKKSDIPTYATPLLRDMMLNFDHKNDYESVKLQAEKKELDIIFCTYQKAGTGMSITTLDYIHVMAMLTGRLEELNQIIGRGERKYTDKQVKEFGHEKQKPLVEILWDSNVGKKDRHGKTKRWYHRYALEQKYKKRLSVVLYKQPRR